jgi:iron complex outermembrane receptor protein
MVTTRPSSSEKPPTGNKQWQISQELQLSGDLFGERLSYVLGGCYFKEKASDDATADLAIGLWAPLAPPPFTPAATIFNRTENESWAAFGQLNFDVTPTLSLTLGGRYSEDSKVFGARDIFQRNGQEYVNVTVSDSWSKFTPQFGVNWKAAEDVLLYASYSEGYKQGGFNGRPLVGPEEVTAYQPETLETYEVGIKAQWLDRALTTNVALFHSKYNDIQLTVNQTPTNFVANAAGGEINGMEFELVARPVSWFAFNAAVGYLDAKYTEVGAGLGPTQVLPITTDSKFVKAPEWTVTTGVEVKHEFADASELAVRGDASLYSRIYHDVANSPLASDNGYVVVNTRVSYTLPGGNIQLAGFVTNLTDELYYVSANVSGAFGLAEASYGRPREYGISASYRF